jgi:hypothetical protein
VSLSAKFDSEFFDFDYSKRKITQIKTIDSSVNQTLGFTLTNENGLSAAYAMKVVFLCPKNEPAANFTPPETHIYKISKVKVPFPVKITSVSRTGIVEIKFFLSV